MTRRPLAAALVAVAVLAIAGCATGPTATWSAPRSSRTANPSGTPTASPTAPATASAPPSVTPSTQGNPPPTTPPAQQPPPPPPANTEACAAAEAAMRTFLGQYFATIFTLVAWEQGGEDAPTEQEVEASVDDLVAAANTFRSALSQIAAQATEPLKSALNQLRSGTDSWPSVFATGDATAIEAAYGNPTFLSAVDSITPICGWEE